MLHIEGAIDDADHDLGVSLLKRASFKVHKDAQRMYTFMDNAFSPKFLPSVVTAMPQSR